MNSETLSLPQDHIGNSVGAVVQVQERKLVEATIRDESRPRKRCLRQICRSEISAALLDTSGDNRKMSKRSTAPGDRPGTVSGWLLPAVAKS
jgi:hypothetical protein